MLTSWVVEGKRIAIVERGIRNEERKMMVTTNEPAVIVSRNTASSLRIPHASFLIGVSPWSTFLPDMTGWKPVLQYPANGAAP
jgi:hypothetical protein